MAGANNVSTRPDGAQLTSRKRPHGGRRRLAFGTPPPLAKPRPEPHPRQTTHEGAKDRLLVLPEFDQLERVPWAKIDRLLIVFDWAWRNAHARGSAVFDTSISQACRGCGGISQPTLWRYMQTLERAGLVTMYGVRDASGRTRRSEVRLLDPDLHSGSSARSSAG